MEKKYFYVKSYDAELFGLEEDSINKLDVDDINVLATFATTLTPLDEVTESAGYVAALYDYYQNNDNALKDCYSKITADSEGSAFLCSTINLCLFEKKFRDMGIIEDNIERYNWAITNYQQQLYSNNQKYANMQTSQKTI